MARPIWSGTLSFGLLNVPVSLMSGERRVDLHFRMLDSRNNARIRYERINAETGAEVPWKDIVKAFEYDKGSYVVLEPEDIKSAAPETHESIDIEAFVDADAIAPQFFEKPYFLVPGKKAEKGYVLLRETLRKTKRIGIARVVIRTREYLCAVMPQGDALLMDLLRYPQELVDADDYTFPSSRIGDYRISKAELAMAEQLIESMSGEWKPGDYKDEFRARLTKVIEKRMKTKGRRKGDRRRRVDTGKRVNERRRFHVVAPEESRDPQAHTGEKSRGQGRREKTCAQARQKALGAGEEDSQTGLASASLGAIDPKLHPRPTEARRAAASPASPFTRSFHESSTPLRRPFSTTFRPSGSMVSVQTLSSIMISRRRGLSSLVMAHAPMRSAKSFTHQQGRGRPRCGSGHCSDTT